MTTTTIDDILSRVPEAEKAAAYAVLAEYGLGMAGMMIEEARAYIARIQSGDIEAVRAVLIAGSWAALNHAANNSADRWERIAANAIRAAKLTNETLLRLAPVVVSILLAIVRGGL